MRALRFSTLRMVLMAALSLPVWAPASLAQTGGIGLNPARLEIETKAGEEKTVSFEIESPPSDIPVRGRLLLNVTDWDIKEDTSVFFTEAGTMADSASPWIVFSPSAVTISSGQTHLVRVTVRVPGDARPGVYRTAIFVQERPPSAPPNRGQQLVYLRFRYVFTMYVMVTPVTRIATVANIAFNHQSDGLQLICDLQNSGTLHVRPLISWTVSDASGRVVAEGRRHEAMVLLPAHRLKQPIPTAVQLPEGEYEIYAEVDFQDSGPVHAIRRKVHLVPGTQTSAR